jgi:hypothetical protein
VANSTLAAFASSFRLLRITAWPSAGGDFGLIAALGGTAEQALQKDSEKISVIPTGVTTSEKARVFSFHKKSYLGMWQLTGVNPNDSMLSYWGTSGTVVDVEGVFTLVGATSNPYPNTVATATLSNVYYPSFDGSTTHVWVPQGLETTH